jgi:hypothetical protein
MGRPDKLTDERAQTIVDAVRRGVPRETAARLAGVAPSTLFLWLSKGQQAASGRYSEFSEAVDRAAAEAEETAIEAIRQAAQGGGMITTRTYTRKDGTVVEEITRAKPDWSAAAWYLERAFRDRWSRVERVDLKLLADQVAHDEGLTPEERDELFREVGIFLRQNKQ